MQLPLHPGRPDGPVYFLSDAHIGAGTPAGEAEKETRLLAFLSRVGENAAALVLLGDLFDFWFEYRHAIPVRGFQVLARLRSLVESGLPIVFIGGNHDFWAGRFLQEQVGVLAPPGALDIEVQGRRLFVAHGDALAPGDEGYKFIRRVFRNPLAIAAFRWIHPDFGIPLATSSSGLSRQHTADIPVVAARLWKEIAAPQFERGRDGVLVGHFHYPVHMRNRGCDFIINGDWMTHWTYSVLTHGTLELRHWPEDTVVAAVNNDI